MAERSAFQRFLSELRRRHVPQTAAVYLVAAWAAIQFADVVVPNLNGPQWVVTAVIVAAGVGFPAVLVLAWIFDWGPDGLHRTDEAAEPGGEPPPAGGPVGPRPTGPASSTPWLTAIAVLVVGIASALAVAALLTGSNGGERAGPERDPPAEPGPAPRLVAPDGIINADSLREYVLRSVGESFVGLEGIQELGRLGEVDLRDFADVVRRSADAAGITVFIAEPSAWRNNAPVPLGQGDTLLVAGLARDTAGIRSVSVDGTVAVEADPAEETVGFQARIVGTGAAGVRRVPVVVRTADGRESRHEYRIVRRPGGEP